MTEQQTILLKEMHKKYNDLVWYARKGTDRTWQPVAESCARIEKDYPKEVDALRSEGGDWDHGFNSGCYAVLNMIMHHNLSEGIQEFPLLDT